MAIFLLVGIVYVVLRNTIRASGWEGLIPLVGGIYGLLIASGVLPLTGDTEEWRVWRQKYGGWTIVLSPLVILFGIAQLLGLV